MAGLTDPGKLRRQLLRVMLKPVVRFCLMNSIRLGAYLEESKAVFLSLAAEEMERAKNKVTISRLSVMTGVHRRDVTRIYREEEVVDESPNLIARVLGYWEQDPRFLTKSGKPKVLTYRGENCEFHTLVESVSREVYPATILFELERTGLVKKGRKGARLLDTTANLRGDPEEGLTLLARDTDTLIKAVEENLFEDHEVPNLHLRTEYNNIFKKDLPVIRRWLFKRGSLFHKQIRDYLSRYDKDINPDPKKQGGGRVVLGAFSWTNKGK